MQFFDLSNWYTRSQYGLVGSLDAVSVGQTADSPVLFAGDDDIIGPEDGTDLLLKTFGGNDEVLITSGVNDISTNWGDDDVYLFGGFGNVRGGSGNDYIEIDGEWYGTVNGNAGNDYITNFTTAPGVIYGGKGNDFLSNEAGATGDFWGNLGADTFSPTSGGGIMYIKDYQPGVDSIDDRYLTGGFAVYTPMSDGSGTWVSDGRSELVAVIENVLLV